MTAMGPRWMRKSRKDRSVALPIRILGGSPMRVAVPPIFDARISAMRNGRDVEHLGDQDRDRSDQEHRRDIVEQRRCDGREDGEPEQYPPTVAPRSLRDLDGDIAEDAGFLYHADEKHHARQESDRVKVDPREGPSLGHDPEHDEQHGSHDGDLGAVDSLGDDENVGNEKDHERRYRVSRHCSPFIS
jgi:hypothetical protein